MRTATRHFSPSDPGSQAERLAGALCLALYSPEGTDLLAAYASIRYAAANYLRDCARGVCVPHSNAFQSALDSFFPPTVKKIRLYLCTRHSGVIDSALTLHRDAPSALAGEKNLEANNLDPRPENGESLLCDSPEPSTARLWRIAYPRLDSCRGRQPHTGVKVEWPFADVYTADVLAGFAPQITSIMFGSSTLVAAAEQLGSERLAMDNAIRVGYLVNALHSDLIGIHLAARQGKIIMRFHPNPDVPLSFVCKCVKINPSSKAGPKKRCSFILGVEDRPLISWSIKGATFYEDDKDARIDFTTMLRELLPLGIVPYVAAGMKTGPLDLFVDHYDFERGYADVARLTRAVRPSAEFPDIRRLGREESTGRVLWSPNYPLLFTLKHHVENQTPLAAAARTFLIRHVLPTGTTVEEYFDDPE